MSNRKQRFVFGVTAIIAGLAMFVVASAYIVARGWPHWLAAAIGAFAFPVAPVGWHVVSERRRRKSLAGAKIAPKAALTGGDRFWLRLLVVALVVIGPMVAIGKRDVLRAIWHHGLWFWPTSYEPSTSHGSPLALIGSGVPRTIDVTGLFARVPADAEAVVWVQSPEQPNERGVFAWGDRQLLVAVEGKKLDDDPAKALAELNKERGKTSWLPSDELVEVKHEDDLFVAASQGWRFRVDPPSAGPSAEMLRELGRAPKDAFLMAGFVPKTDVLSIKSGAAWIAMRGDNLLAEGRLEASSEAAAKHFIDEANRELDKIGHNVPEKCRADVAKIIRAIQLDQTGAIVTGRLEMRADHLVGVMFCGFR